MTMQQTDRSESFGRRRWAVGLVVPLVLFLCCPAAPAKEQRLAVTGAVANIRSGPGTKHDVMWQVGRYHPIKVRQKSGNWYLFVDFEGDEGWIHRSLVGELDTVITDKPKCNVRSGPGTKNKVLFSVGKGIPFKAVERKGNWIRVVHADGDGGWIHKSLVW
jgi:SH3-like domain-containing protein